MLHDAEVIQVVQTRNADANEHARNGMMMLSKTEIQSITLR